MCLPSKAYIRPLLWASPVDRGLVVGPKGGGDGEYVEEVAYVVASEVMDI